ncbi:hypothetical protein CC80DRAFT_555809 [Byssothecium circinans]|uniref:Uncharacterized protein n=1 Tax=Byssothecium circinans TaxID=147558 RepID=A0A6A5TBE2_9PLEO|nr:hypothetical protein CC80DRAFT_555809 [Byssothecium circinans]
MESSASMEVVSPQTIRQVYAKEVTRLTEAFVKGWRSLPDEVKLMVLKHYFTTLRPTHPLPLSVNNLRLVPPPYQRAVTRGYFNKRLPRAPCYRTLLPLLACPEPTNITKEAFAATNTFYVNGFKYSPQPYTKWIRLLEVEIVLTRVNGSGSANLQGMSWDSRSCEFSYPSSRMLLWEYEIEVPNPDSNF